MAETFADLGLRPELVDATEAAGYAAPSPIQAAAVPVLRRGGNAVLSASSGAGVVAAWALGLLDRLAEEASTGSVDRGGRPRMLVLLPTTATADRVALSVARFGRAIDVPVTALGPAWPGASATATVTVAATESALAAVGTSRLKLDAVQAVVIGGVAEQFELGGGEALESLVGSIPSDAQRVAVSGESPEPVERFVEAYVRRALHIPPRSADGDEHRTSAEPAATLGYAVVPEGAGAESAALLLRAGDADASAALFCRTAERARRVADALALRGFDARPAGTDAEPGRVVIGDGGDTDEMEVPEGRTISYDVPFDVETLETRHVGGGQVLVLPREVPHMRRIAARSRLRLNATTLPAPERAAAGLDEFRDRLRRAASEEDLAAQWLVLEPLLDEFTAAELAAATSALLRRRPSAGEEATRTEGAPARRSRRPAGGAAPPAGPAPPAWQRLFMSVGRRDGVGPGDIVGAITGETSADGEQVGRIEIMDTFSIVEVANEVAESVIGSMNGITLKGRSLRVDYDRKASRGGGGAGGAGGRGGGGGRGGRRSGGGGRGDGGRDRSVRR